MIERKCLRYSRGHVGYPCIAPLDRERCVIADGTGQLRVIDLALKRTLARIFVGAMQGAACRNLCSLCVEPTRSRMVAVATRGGYAVIVDFDRQAVEKVYPNEGGSVNSVAFAPDGDYLVMGTGYYPLGDGQQPAHIELWMLPDGKAPEYLAFAAVPGVCVDAITWSDDRIACATGLRSQQGGSIAELDSSLRAVSFFETSWVFSRRLGYLDLDGHLGVVFNGGFRVVNSRDGNEAWRVDQAESPDSLQDFAYDADHEEIVLTTGVVLSAFDGEEQKRFESLKECTSIAVRPGGGYLGVSTRGRICCWD